MAGQPQEPSWSPHPPTSSAPPGYSPPPPQAAQQQYGYPPPGSMPPGSVPPGSGAPGSGAPGSAPGYAPAYGDQTQAYTDQTQGYGDQTQVYGDQTQVYGGRPQGQGYGQAQGYPQDYGQGAGQSPAAPQWQGQGQGQGQDQAQWHQAPPPQTFRPSRPVKSARPARQGKGFVSSLFDFGFTSFVTPKIIKVLYALVTIWTILWALALLDIGFRYGHAVGGLITLIVVDPILILMSLGVIRVVLEFFMLSFRMQEDLKALRENSQANRDETSADGASNGD
ncbi:MAG TPA: DUF4282 domain-containing protein [Trebonia sp.]|nr:DUF4282 domain-containing protein [Trebonia sp.]